MNIGIIEALWSAFIHTNYWRKRTREAVKQFPGISPPKDYGFWKMFIGRYKYLRKGNL